MSEKPWHFCPRGRSTHADDELYWPSEEIRRTLRVGQQVRSTRLSRLVKRWAMWPTVDLCARPTASNASGWNWMLWYAQMCA